MIEFVWMKEGDIVRYRIEQDILGEKQISAEAYYGIHTLRGKENFDLTKRGLNRQMIKALATIKKSAALANADMGNLKEDFAKAIALSCDEILNGRLHGQFITDFIQGDSGSSMNMNANEVIANRANEMLGSKKGLYDLVNPITHVNMGQSTYDVIPSAGKIALVRQTKKLVVELKKLTNSFSAKSSYFKNGVIVNETLTQTFDAFSIVLTRDMKRIESAIEGLLDLNLGVSISGDNSRYIKKLVANISKFTGEAFRPAKNFIDSTINLDSFLQLSGILKTLAVDLLKISNDLRFIAGNNYGEITLPIVQELITKKSENVNSTILETVNQVCFYAIGLDSTVTHAIEMTQLETNENLPIVLYSLFEALNTLRRAIRTFREKAIDDIILNK